MEANMISQLCALMRCPQCQACPMATPVFMCMSGHHTCCHCYNENLDIKQQEYDDNPDAYESGLDAVCTLCDQPLTDIRNRLAEKVVKMVNACSALNNGGKTSYQLSKSEHGLHTIMLVEHKQASKPMVNPNLGTDMVGSVRTRSEHGTGAYSLLNRPSLSDLSDASCCSSSGPSTSSSAESVDFMSRLALHLPVRCPKKPCAKMIPCSTLITHFTFNHRDIITFEMPRHQPFHVWHIPTTSTEQIERIICLVYLSNEDKNSSEHEDFPIVHNPSHLRNRIPFVLMTTRLPCTLNTAKQWHRYSNNPNAQNDDSLIDEFLLFWLCGVDGTSFSYTLEVSATGEEDSVAVRSLTYTGNVVSLKETLLPLQVLAAGLCMILPPGFVNNLTENNGGLGLNITIH